eukprot:SM000041S15549  [mRNA]  locus=s41:802025:804944:+ [translate_table: standard]
MQSKLARHLGPRFLLHGKQPPSSSSNATDPASSTNSYLSTLRGIDVAGARLAAEVQLEALALQRCGAYRSVAGIVKRSPHLERISFVAHSLGGLFARYAIAKLYQLSDLAQAPGTVAYITADLSMCARRMDRAGFAQIRMSKHREALQQVTWTKLPPYAGFSPSALLLLRRRTLALAGTSRYKADCAIARYLQLPFLLGLSFLERVAMPIAPLVAGQTGRQLFLSDKHMSGQPLLLNMASDCEEGPFISALGLFQLRATYANVGYDRIPKTYYCRHLVQKLNLNVVKQTWFHFEGAEVIRHLIDLLVQQEQSVPLLQASL